MTNSIVYADLPESISKEFSVIENGNTFVTRRGLARLCGVDEKSIRAWLKLLKTGAEEKLPRNLKRHCGFTIESAEQIPDLVAASFIKYYAKQNEIAENTDDALGAIGLRTVIQNMLGYQPVARRSLTQAEIIELCILPVPSIWKCRFKEDYYEQLSRLTGLEQFGTSRPPLWAKYTKELVYDWLPNGIYEAVKRCKAETNSFDKLHQFLSPDGLEILRLHQDQLITLMIAAESMEQLKKMVTQSCTGNYQLVLMSK
jgi:hypothetical protein